MTQSIPESAFLTKNAFWIPAGIVAVTAVCADSLLNKAHSGEVGLMNTLSVYHVWKLGVDDT